MNQSVEQLGHIGVLMGGCSSEREISLKSGKAVYKALKEMDCRVSEIDITSKEEKNVVSCLNQFDIDLAFIALHGEFGEDGQIQAILEKRGLPYTGSDSETSRLAMNKISTQELLKKHQFPVAPFYAVSKHVDVSIDHILESLGGVPVVVKPATEGSSIGITVVHEKENLAQALSLGFQYGTELLIDKYVSGKEITAGILDGKALPLVEIRPESAFFDFAAKYEKGKTKYIVPAEISEKEQERIQQVAVAAYQKIGCRDFARLDFILDEQGNIFILEANTIPGFTETSLLPMAAQREGMHFGELCLKIACLAAKRQGGVKQVTD